MSLPGAAPGEQGTSQQARCWQGELHRVFHLFSNRRLADVVPRPLAPYLPEIGLLLLASLTLLPGLGSTYFWDPDEPRFADATRHMLRDGGVLAPVFNGEPRWEKPILLYWLQLAFFHVAGPTEWAARLPAAIAGIVSVLFLYRLGRRLMPAGAALIGTVLWLTAFRFVTYARQGLTDMPVVACIIGAMLAFTQAIQAGEKPARSAVWLGWTAVGIGVLFKGPVGLLPVIIGLAVIALRRDWAMVPRLRPIAGAALAVALTLPWYLYALATDAARFFDVHVERELVARSFSAEFGGPVRGWFYYLRILPGEVAPWTLLVGIALLWVSWRATSTDRQERQATHLLLTWAAVVLAVFSLARYKLPHYTLPAYPPLFLLTGWCLYDGCTGRAPWRTVARAGLVTTALVVAIGIEVIAAVQVRLLETVTPWTVGFMVLALGAAWAAWLAWRGRTRPAMAAVTISVALVYAAVAVGWSAYVRERWQAPQRLAELAAHQLPAGMPLAVLGIRPSAVFYADRTVRFLTGAPEAARWMTAPGQQSLMIGRRDLEALRMSGLQVDVLARVPTYTLRLKHLIDGRALRPSDELMLVIERP